MSNYDERKKEEFAKGYSELSRSFAFLVSHNDRMKIIGNIENLDITFKNRDRKAKDHKTSVTFSVPTKRR